MESDLEHFDESTLGETTGKKTKKGKAAPPAPPVVDEEVARQMRLIERRLVNPIVTSDRTIRLKDANLVIHIFNGDRPGRLYQAVHELGWRPLKLTDLVERAQIGDIQVSPEGYVTRGEKGREMYMVMPRDAFNAIQRKKVEIRDRKQNLHTKGARAQKDELAEATANRFGSDEAGETIKKFHGTNPDRSVVMELDS